MEASKCAKCGNSTFELKENKPDGSEYKFYFIQCKTCGTVIGTHEYYNLSYLLKRQEEQLENIKRMLLNLADR